MSSLLYEIIFILSLSYCLTGPILPSYERDEGDWPVGTSADMNNVIDRWFIDIKDAKCKPLEYRGIKGNYNNFASKGLCEMHATLTEREKLQGCKKPMHPGHCVKNAQITTQQYYFDQTKARCLSFQYNGCGGSFNRYASEDECYLFCFNKKNGGLTNADDTVMSTLADAKKTKYTVPNSLDCTLRPDVKDKDPSTAIIADPAKNKCAYAAVSIDSNTRGIFSSFKECVKTSHAHDAQINADTGVTATNKKVQACSGTPHQTTFTTEAEIRTRYYYDSSEKVCKQMLSGQNAGGPTGPEFVVTQNDFPTMEMCHSYCGAERYKKEIKVEETCIQGKGGVAGTGTFLATRYYYDNANNVCQAFKYKGYDGNSNNFTTGEQCKKICGEVYKQQRANTSINISPETV